MIGESCGVSTSGNKAWPEQEPTARAYNRFTFEETLRSH